MNRARTEATLRISRNVGLNARRLRGELGRTARQVAVQTQDTHHPMSREVLGTVERGRHPNGLGLKSVSVDELMALAAVLSVSPLSLLSDPDSP